AVRSSRLQEFVDFVAIIEQKLGAAGVVGNRGGRVDAEYVVQGGEQVLGCEWLALGPVGVAVGLANDPAVGDAPARHQGKAGLPVVAAVRGVGGARGLADPR